MENEKLIKEFQEKAIFEARRIAVYLEQKDFVNSHNQAKELQRLTFKLYLLSDEGE